jgi:hypothetical protein
LPGAPLRPARRFPAGTTGRDTLEPAIASQPEGYVYVLSPINFWAGWSGRETAVPDHEAASVREQFRAQVDETLEHALEQFRRRTGWEGDVREGPNFAGFHQRGVNPKAI